MVMLKAVVFSMVGLVCMMLLSWWFVENLYGKEGGVDRFEYGGVVLPFVGRVGAFGQGDGDSSGDSSGDKDNSYFGSALSSEFWLSWKGALVALSMIVLFIVVTFVAVSMVHELNQGVIKHLDF